MLTLTARKNLILKVTKQQSDILIGCILGDAYITKSGKIQIEQSDKQIDYVNWKYNQLEKICYGLPKKVIRYDKRYNKNYISYRFWTRQFFRNWRKRFYLENKKIFPLESISPLTLAVWYMDDGCLNENKRIILSTDNFNEEDRTKIKNLFKKDFDIDVSYKNKGKMIIGTNESKKFFKIINPYTIPSMKYKILTP